MLNSKTFCPYAYFGLTLTNQGKVHPCAAVRPMRDQKSVSRLEQILEEFNSPSMQKLRREMARGERPEVCRKCFHFEDAGLKSKRQKALEKYADQLPHWMDRADASGIQDFQPSLLNLRLGNKCNLRCRMCGPESSRAFVAEWRQSEIASLRMAAERFSDAWSWSSEQEIWLALADRLEFIQSLTFAGGEPFLYRDYEPLLERAIESGHSRHIDLYFNSNMTELPEALSWWAENFRHVAVDASIDGVGSLNEYIRYPSRWSKTLENFEYLQKLSAKVPTFYLDACTAVSALNILNLNELFDFFRAHPLTGNQILPSFQIVYSPDYLNPRVLPIKFKQKAQKRLSDYLASVDFSGHPRSRQRAEQIERLIHYLDTPDEPKLMRKFRQMTFETDRLRSQNSSNFEFSEALSFESTSIVGGPAQDPGVDGINLVGRERN